MRRLFFLFDRCRSLAVACTAADKSRDIIQQGFRTQLSVDTKADDSPVDVVGLSIFPGHRTMDEVRAGLDVLTRWCARVPGDRKLKVIEDAPGSYVAVSAHE